MHRILTRSKGRTVSVDHHVGIGARMMTRLGRQTAEPYKVRATFCAKQKITSFCLCCSFKHNAAGVILYLNKFRG